MALSSQQSNDDDVVVKPLSSVLGAQIDNVDLTRPIGERQFSQMRNALFDHGVIVFRDQRLTPEQHIAFAERWGTINVNRFFRPVDGYPMIAEVRKEPHQQQNIGALWHTDHSYDSAPALGSVVYARQVPDYGGDTVFASMYAAYDALSDGFKQTLANLTAIHSSRHVFGRGKSQQESHHDGRIGNSELAQQDATHPVVIAHPGSGRKALYVNPQFTVRLAGWSDEESASVMNYLYRHAGQPQFTCRISWQLGTLVIWDNRATWHCALNDYQGQTRVLHRITIEGEPLRAAKMH